jgi:hypothetical protein
MVLDVFSSGTERDDQVSRLDALLRIAGPPDHFLVVGPNWLVNCDTYGEIANSVQSNLGGGVTTIVRPS